MDKLIKNYGKRIDWNVGSLVAHDNFVLGLIKYCKGLDIEVPIKYAFGSIPCVLQGGRLAPNGCSVENMYEIMAEYNDYGIGCRLTFSNNLITEEDLKDDTSNKLLQFLNRRKNNGVIISSELLYDHIRDKYPNLEIISSQVKPAVEVGLGNDDVHYYNDLLGRYDVVVVNPDKIHDDVFLDNLSDKSKVEFIANCKCVPNCPYAKAHYETQCKIQKKFLSNEKYDLESEQLAKITSACMKFRANNPLVGLSMSNEDIGKLVDKGFIHFKIEGRTCTEEMFSNDIGNYIFNFNVYERLLHAND